jgi:hypothetical protein
MRTLLASALLLACSVPALAQEAYPAKLVGHAVVPAASFVEAPADAPVDLKTSGKFTTGKRVEAVGSVEGTSAGRPTGIKRMPDGTFWVLTDNGMGSKANSPDSMLYLNRYRIDWNTGTAERLETMFLADSDKKVPFRIANEGADTRYLTGADLDTEGFQPIGGKF